MPQKTPQKKDRLVIDGLLWFYAKVFLEKSDGTDAIIAVPYFAVLKLGNKIKFRSVTMASKTMKLAGSKKKK